MAIQIKSVSSELSPWEVFQNIYRKEDICFFLDSHQNLPPNQNYSVIGYAPSFSVKVENKKLYISKKEITKAYPSDKLFHVLRRTLKAKKISKKTPYPLGGFYGFFGYESTELFEKIKYSKKEKNISPDVFLGFYENVIVYDHAKKKYKLISHNADKSWLKRTLSFLSEPISEKRERFLLEKLSPEMPQNKFKRAVDKAKEYIQAGDIYQANLSQKFHFSGKGSKIELYEKLRKINPSPFSCYLKIKNLEILSSSPERLVQKRGRFCSTRPIAGTCSKKGNIRSWQKKLIHNEKERAEHIMLLDLERNDLGRVCDYKSIQVKDFMALEKYSHVVHIVSDIIGRLKKDKDAFDLIKTMFPGGTITGCPKVRCMEIIDELEPSKRGIYTGSIGYIDLQENMDFNIVIRTIVMNRDKGFLQVGAGIVYDSKSEKEYQETLHKAEALFKALKT